MCVYNGGLYLQHSETSLVFFLINKKVSTQSFDLHVRAQPAVGVLKKKKNAGWRLEIFYRFFAGSKAARSRPANAPRQQNED